MADARWTFIAYAVTKALGFIGTIILARLLTPSDFGLMAFVIALSGVMLVLGDLGVGNTLMTRRDLEPEDENAIFAVYLAMGPALAILLVVCCGIAFAVDNAPIAELLGGAAAMFMLSGPSWFFVIFARRLLRFRLFCAAQVVQAIVMFTVSVVLASKGAGAWSLLLGQAAGMVALTLVFAVALRHPVRPEFDSSRMKNAVYHGRGFFAQSGIGYLSQNADNFGIGITQGSSALGFYSMAYRLAETPYQALGNPIYQVTFPRFAEIHKAGGDVRPDFLRSVTLIVLLAAPPAALMVTCSDALMKLLYGPGWGAAADVLMVLGIWGLLRPTQAAVGWLLNSLNRPDEMAKFAATMLVATVPAIFVSAAFAGIQAVAAVMLGAMLVSFVGLLKMADRYAQIAPTLVLRAAAAPTLTAVGIAVPLHWLFPAAVESSSPWLATSGLLVGASVLYLALVTMSDRASREVVRDVRQRITPYRPAPAAGA